MAIAAERVRSVSFDLDGTLIDSLPDLAGAVNETLAELGAPPLPPQQILTYVGDGADKLVLRAVAESFRSEPDDPARDTQALAIFSDRYDQRLFHDSRVYPGVPVALRALLDAGMTVSCITNKDARFALPLLEVAGLSKLLAFTLCPQTTADRKPNPKMLSAACRKLEVEPDEFLYVGDTYGDIVAAHAAGAQAIAVSYGYNHKGPMSAVNPEDTVDTLMEVVTRCLGLRSRAGG